MFFASTAHRLMQVGVDVCFLRRQRMDAAAKNIHLLPTPPKTKPPQANANEGSIHKDLKYL